MGTFLQSLRTADACHTVEPSDDGFAIVRRSVGDKDAFNDLAREAINRSGADFVALPRPDGSAGYDQVIIIPLD